MRLQHICAILQVQQERINKQIQSAIIDTMAETRRSRTSARWESPSILPMGGGLLPIGSSSWLSPPVGCALAIGDGG
jgi:hypothetical protein